MIEENKTYKTVLTIAGFDGSGGAGIQADLKTYAALGCYGLSVLTALPVQNTCGVQKIYAIEKQCLLDQLQSILEDIKVDAIKIGMLHTKENITCLCEVLHALSHPSVVLDPVLLAKSGNVLLSKAALNAMIQSLFPLTTVLTPNLDEASTILGEKIDTKDKMELAAVKLWRLGPKGVVIKGGHLNHPTCEDCLYFPDADPKIQWLSSPRISSNNVHGTGCTFSSALAAFLAKGYGISEATRLTKKFLFRAIEEGTMFQLGQGHGPLHHFFEHWRQD